MMLMTARVPMSGANSRVASGNSGKPSFMKPYVPILSRTPARITEPAVGASTCASGSHVCSGHDRHLDRERQAERGEQHGLHRQRQLRAVEVGERERRHARRRVERVHEVDDRRQHQDAAERRVEDELERGVDAPLAAPDADDEEHRDHHRFPEQVEQEEVLRDEGAQHRELDQEHHRVEELHVLAGSR